MRPSITLIDLSDYRHHWYCRFCTDPEPHLSDRARRLNQQPGIAWEFRLADALPKNLEFSFARDEGYPRLGIMLPDEKLALTGFLLAIAVLPVDCPQCGYQIDSISMDVKGAVDRVYWDEQTELIVSGKTGAQLRVI